MRKFKEFLSNMRDIMKWYEKVMFTIVMSVLAFIGMGIVETKSLEARVIVLERKTSDLSQGIKDFQSNVKEDIGHIKGQNDLIIKLLNKHGDK